MRLGIAVVYLVSEKNERLLDLQLSQIDANTQVPYTIYACVNRLLPRFREKLERHPNIRICPCKTYQQGTGLLKQDAAKVSTRGLAAVGSKYEHSFYLEQLIRTAIEDGVTHVAMLHVDSFPIRPGWAKELADKLNDRCVLVGVTRNSERDHKPLTAGILYHRDFYLKYQPRLLLSQEEFDSEDYQRYYHARPHVTDSGFGYGFKMFMENLTWYPLIRSNKGGEHSLFASVHGDLIFHLHAAEYVERTQTVGFSNQGHGHRSNFRKIGTSVARAVLPEGVRMKVRSSLPQRIRDPQDYMDRQAWEHERQCLFDNPEAYLTYLRTGVR
jgi:hypothetical protein